MTNEQENKEKVKGTRGRPQEVNQEQFLSVFQASTTIDDMLNKLPTLMQRVNKKTGEVKQLTLKQAKLYVSMRASQLRNKGFVLVNALGKEKFTAGPTKKTAVVDNQQKMVAE